MYRCESWTIKKAKHQRIDFWTVVVEKTLESPLDCKEIKPINPKGNQSWIFIGRADAEAETPILWPPDGKNWLIRKDPDAGKDCNVGGEGDNKGWDGWMASPTRWTWVWASLGSWDGQGILVCCSSWGHRVGNDWATELNWPCPRLLLDFLSCGVRCNPSQADQCLLWVRSCSKHFYISYTGIP